MTMLNQAALKENSCVLALPLTTQYVSGSDTITPDVCRFSGHTVHNATVLGTKAMHVGKDGLGLMYFDGNDYLYISDHSDLSLTDSLFSIFIWFKRGTSGVVETLLGQCNDTGSSLSFLFRFGYRNANCLEFDGYSSSGNVLLGSGAITDSNWHSALICRGSSTDWKMYLDGILVSTSSLNYTLYDISSNIAIGRAGEYNGQYFTGYLRYPMIFKGKALGIVQLRSLMEETRPDYI